MVIGTEWGGVDLVEVVSTTVNGQLHVSIHPISAGMCWGQVVGSRRGGESPRVLMVNTQCWGLVDLPKHVFLRRFPKKYYRR